MASLTFRRAGWLLQVSRSSRLFSVSLSAPLSRHRRPHRSPILDAQHPGSSLHRNSLYQQSRRAFSAVPSYQQEAAAESVAPPSERAAENSTPKEQTVTDLTSGFQDAPAYLPPGQPEHVDWSRSYHGLSSGAFSKETTDLLLAPIDPMDVEVKPDGIIYLPEIKYRRILNRAFGPGAWGLAPRGETIVTPKAVTREYALVVLGRLVSVARGEQDYFSPESIPTASEGCKSNALLRCCKDLGVASELWDPRFIRKFLNEHVRELWVEHMIKKQRKKIFIRKDDRLVYPWKEITSR